MPILTCPTPLPQGSCIHGTMRHAQATPAAGRRKAANSLIELVRCQEGHPSVVALVKTRRIGCSAKLGDARKAPRTPGCHTEICQARRLENGTPTRRMMQGKAMKKVGKQKKSDSVSVTYCWFRGNDLATSHIMRHKCQSLSTCKPSQKRTKKSMLQRSHGLLSLPGIPLAHHLSGSQHSATGLPTPLDTLGKGPKCFSSGGHFKQMLRKTARLCRLVQELAFCLP